MHTFKGKHTTFHYNSDMSGKVTINVTGTSLHINVDGEDLISFVLEWVRNQAIGWLEQIDIQKYIKER